MAVALRGHQVWPSGGSAHPRVLDLDDAARLADAVAVGSLQGGRARRKLFARKVEATTSAALLDVLHGWTSDAIRPREPAM